MGGGRWSSVIGMLEKEERACGTVLYVGAVCYATPREDRGNQIEHFGPAGRRQLKAVTFLQLPVLLILPTHQLIGSTKVFIVRKRHHQTLCPIVPHSTCPRWLPILNINERCRPFLGRLNQTFVVDETRGIIPCLPLGHLPLSPASPASR